MPTDQEREIAQMADGAIEFGKNHTIQANAFRWIDPPSLPKRNWLIPSFLLRKYVSVLTAEGGVGKSSMLVTLALQLTHQKQGVLSPFDGNLYGHFPKSPLKVWLYNLEDPIEELQLRVQATMMAFNLSHEHIEDRLFLNSGRDQELIIAEQTRDGIEINEPVVDALVSEIKDREIDVLIIDPFVSSHRVSENDNGAMDTVLKKWMQVADHANCGIVLVHHTRKSNGTPIGVEAMRGSSSIAAAARVVIVAKPYSDIDVTTFGLSDTVSAFSIKVEKANLSSKQKTHQDWLIDGYALPNGDSIGVAKRFKPATDSDLNDDTVAKSIERIRDLPEEERRENAQASKWIGYRIGPLLGLDPNSKAEKRRIKAHVTQWVHEGVLERYGVNNGKKEQPHLRVAETPPPPPPANQGEAGSEET